jgi:hypothetical protein
VRARGAGKRTGTGWPAWEFETMKLYGELAEWRPLVSAAED